MKMSTCRPVLVFAIWAFFALPAVSDDAVLQVEPGEASPGKTAVVSLSLTESSQIGALEATLHYDPQLLEYVGVEPGPGAPQTLVQANVTSPGALKLAMISSNGITGQGAVVEVSFTVKADVGAQVNLELNDVQAHHFEKLVELPIHGEGGELLVITITNQPEPVADLLKSIPREWLIYGGAGAGILLLLLIAFRLGKGSRS